MANGWGGSITVSEIADFKSVPKTNNFTSKTVTNRGSVEAIGVLRREACRY